MARNVLKEPEEEPQEEQQSEGRPPRRRLKLPFVGNLGLDVEQLFGNMPYFVFITFLGIIYIANSQYAVQTVKDINRLQVDLRQVGWESNSKKAELMYESTQAQMFEKVYPLGLRQLQDKPKKIIVPKGKYDTKTSE